MKQKTDEVESERRWDDLFAKSRDMLLEMAADNSRGRGRTDGAIEPGNVWK